MADFHDGPASQTEGLHANKGGWMYQVIGAVRILLLSLLVLFGLVAGLFAGFMSLSAYQRLARWWHGCIMHIIGVESSLTGSSIEPGSLVISNHTSWLDIPLIGSRLPVVFLANSEIASWPVLGWMIRSAGTLFIERGNGSVRAVDEISQKLAQGESVQIFPEGKTTDGSSVARFHPRLLQSAITAGTSVQPIGVRYQRNDGAREFRVRFDGATTFPVSLWRTVAGPKIQATIRVFEPISTDFNRDTIARQAQQQIRSWVEEIS